jgi:capsid protein
MAVVPRTKTQRSIVTRWQRARGDTLSGDETSGTNTYPGSAVTDSSFDFLGDWRSADSWQRFDMWRVRNRSRQLERGNPACIAFKRNMLNNVLGFKGFHYQASVITRKIFGDTTDGEPDDPANKQLVTLYDDFGKPENFTTRKKYSRRDLDRLILSRLIFDGEVILRKVRGFSHNDYAFSWQMIDPDYLDQNLNRQADNGNIIKMGVELDKTWKFPVAYWFLQKRPNDWFYNYQDINESRYYRVDASEVLHIH